MSQSIPVNIPGKFHGHGDISSQSLCIRRQTSITISGSFFGASSVNHPRNSGVNLSVNDPVMERKLSRTRKMSETIRSLVESKRMATIPTQKEDITLQWVLMIMNQSLLKSGKAPLDQDSIEGLQFQVFDCKSR